MNKFSVKSKYISASPRSQRRKGAVATATPSAGVAASSGVDRSYIDANFVNLFGDQAIEGLKDFINGFKIGGALVKYDTVKKCFIFTENVLMEKGLAWNSRFDDFTDEEIFSITKAVDVDWETIGKRADGKLYVIPNGSAGGGLDENELANYLSTNKYITESALDPYAKTENVNSLLTDYLPKSGGTVNGNVTATKFIGALQGNADSATIAGDSTMLIYPQVNNEINFGGTHSREDIYFGYRSIDGRPTPKHYIFGNGSSADVKAKTFIGALEGTASNAEMFCNLSISDFSRFVSAANFDANEVPNGVYGGKLFGATNWVLNYYSFLSVGNKEYKMQFNGCNNQLYYRAGNESGLSDKPWREVLFVDSGSLSPASGTLTVNGNVAATGFIAQNAYGGAKIEFDDEIGQNRVFFVLDPNPNNGVGMGLDYLSFEQRADGVATIYSPYLSLTFRDGKVLEVNGNILATGLIAWNSSRVLKTEIKEHYLSLDKLALIKPYQYKWKDGRDALVHVGAIADEVKPIIPETVITDAQNIHSMDYAQTAFVMAASLTPHVSDHERRIKELETENKALKREIEKLKRAA